MNEFIFKIVNNGKVAPEFIRANLYLMYKYNENFQQIKDDQDKLKMLSKIWLFEFKAYLKFEDKIPSSIVFEELGDLLLWKIKWSN